MDVHRATISIPDIDDVTRLYFISDTHLGEAGSHVEFLRRAVRYVAGDPRAAVITTGDLAGFIAPDDARFDPEAVAPGLEISHMATWGDAMVEIVKDVMGPLKGRVICSLSGNHENVYAKKKNSRVNSAVADSLGSKALGYCAFIILNFRDRTGRTAQLRIAATHGGSGATTPGGKFNALMKFAEGFCGFDLFVYSHVHACLDGWLPPRLGERDGDIVEHELPYGLVTGTTLRTYTKGVHSYGERKTYRPTHIGFPCLHLVPSSREMWTRWVMSRTLEGQPRYSGFVGAA